MVRFEVKTVFRFSRLLILPLISLPFLIIGFTLLPFIFFWYQLLPIIGLSFLAVASWFIPFWWIKRVPETARILERAAREKKPVALIAHDTGRAALTLIEERMGEGVVVTDSGNYKILPQYARVEETEGEGKGNPEKLYEKDYRDFITKRTILTGLDLPFFIGYAGKLTLLNPEALALYEAGDMYVKTSEGPLFNPNKKKDRSIRKALQPLMLLDIRKIKDLIGVQFDVTQIAAIITESERIGYLGSATPFKKYLPLIGLLLLAMVVGLLLLLGGPKIMQMLQGMGGGV